jgi:hypothetical protein
MQVNERSLTFKTNFKCLLCAGAGTPKRSRVRVWVIQQWRQRPHLLPLQEGSHASVEGWGVTTHSSSLQISLQIPHQTQPHGPSTGRKPAVSVFKGMEKNCSINSTVKPVNSYPVKWGHPVKYGHFIWSQNAVSANCPLKWGHLWIRDTFGLSQGCPYFTGLTVYVTFRILISLKSRARVLRYRPFCEYRCE